MKERAHWSHLPGLDRANSNSRLHQLMDMDDGLVVTGREGEEGKKIKCQNKQANK